MATFSSYFTDTRFRLDIDHWETAVDEGNNTSTVVVTLNITKVGTSTVNNVDQPRPYWLKIDGVTVRSGTFTYDWRSSTVRQLCTITTTIAHNDDGTKILSLQCYADMNDPTGSNLGTATAGGNLTLTAIIRGVLSVWSVGAWRRSKGVWVWSGGAWRRAKGIWVWSGGAWRRSK